MKFNKKIFITPTSIAVAIAPLATLTVSSCTNDKTSDQQHFVEPTQEEKTKAPLSGVLQADYEFTMIDDVNLADLSIEMVNFSLSSSNDTVEPKDVLTYKIKSLSERKLVCNVCWNDWAQTTQTANFDFKITHIKKGWTNTISGLSLKFTPAAEIQSIEIDTLPNKIDYTYGENFTLEGLRVKVTTDVGSRVMDYDKTIMTPSFFEGNPVKTSAATKHIDIFLNDKHDGFDINVSPVPLMSFAKCDKTFTVGQTISKSDVELNVVYSNEQTTVLPSERWRAEPSIDDGYTFDETGATSFDFFVDDYTTSSVASLGVNVSEAYITDLSVEVKTNVFVGQTLNYSDFSVIATFSDQTQRVIFETEYQCSKELPYTFTADDITESPKITIEYEGIAKEFTFNVNYPTFRSISISSPRVLYGVGEVIEPKNLQVTGEIEISDGTYETINVEYGDAYNQYKVLIPNSSSVEAQELTLPHTITAQDFIDWGSLDYANIPIKVKGKNGEFFKNITFKLYSSLTLKEIEVIPAKTSFKLGEVMTVDDLFVQNVYTNGSVTSTELDDQNFSISPALPCTFLSAGANTFTITSKVKPSISKTFTVNVEAGEVESIEISKFPPNEFEVGETFTKNDIQVLAHFAGGVSYLVPYNKSGVTGYKISTNGVAVDFDNPVAFINSDTQEDKPYKIEFGNKSVDFTIDVYKNKHATVTFKPGSEAVECDQWTYSDSSLTTASYFASIPEAKRTIPTSKTPGYTFIGWSNTDGGELINLDTEQIKQDRVVYARYTTDISFDNCTKCTTINSPVTITVQSTAQSSNDDLPNLYVTTLENGHYGWKKVNNTEGITIPKNSTFYLRGNNPSGWSSSTVIRSIRFTGGPVNIGGSILGLINDGKVSPSQQPVVPEYCFKGLFANNNQIYNIDEDYIKDVKISKHAFESTFAGCTNLGIAPKLPETKFKDYCYYGMFRGCTNLLVPPSNIDENSSWYDNYAESCFESMFEDCIALDHPFGLKTVTTVYYSDNCFKNMYKGCKGLQITTDQSVGSHQFVELYTENPKSIAEGMFIYFDETDTLLDTPPNYVQLYYSQNSSDTEGIRSWTMVDWMSMCKEIADQTYYSYPTVKTLSLSGDFDRNLNKWSADSGYLRAGNTFANKYQPKNDLIRCAYNKCKLSYVLNPGETIKVNINYAVTIEMYANWSFGFASTRNDVMFHFLNLASDVNPRYISTWWYTKNKFRTQYASYVMSVEKNLNRETYSEIQTYTETIVLKNNSKVRQVINYYLGYVSFIDGSFDGGHVGDKNASFKAAFTFKKV